MHYAFIITWLERKHLYWWLAFRFSQWSEWTDYRSVLLVNIWLYC